MKVYKVMSIHKDLYWDEWMCDACFYLAPGNTDAFKVDVAEVCPFCGLEDEVKEEAGYERRG